jgi:hypothetical protein
LITTALKYLISIATPQPLELEQRPYTTAQVFPVKTPLPAALDIHTLTGIKDYLNENIDGLELDHLMVHVLGPKHVLIRSRLTGPFEDRAGYVTATHAQPEFKFNSYMDIETFIIELQSKFIQDELTAKILQLAGTITHDQIQIYADDGVTQAVTAKTSVGMQAQREVPNPVMLSPRRTFNEVQQPLGRFVLRMKSGTGTSSGRPAVALFEADGGMWELEAIEIIRKWLQENIPTDVTIIA